MKHVSGRITVGIILLIVAALFAADALFPGQFFQNIADFASLWWPAALILIGVVGLFSGGNFTFNLLLSLAGVWILADKLGWTRPGLFLPFVLFVIAVLVFASAFRGRRPASGGSTSSAGFGSGPARPAGTAADAHVFSAFSGHDARNASQEFRFAEVTAIFGGSSLDLRDAKLSPEGARVDITALFGGADVIVPENWVLQVSSTPIFGGVDNRTSNLGTPAEGQPILHVNATAIFGGAGIKNRPDHDRT
jgi:hypothetical protein